MDNESLKQRLSLMLPSGAFEEGAQWLTLTISPTQFKALATQLRQEPDLDFDFLFCVTALDWKTHLTMVYHLTSTRHRHPGGKSVARKNRPEITDRFGYLADSRISRTRSIRFFWCEDFLIILTCADFF